VPGRARRQRIADGLDRPDVASVAEIEEDSNGRRGNRRSRPPREDASEKDGDDDNGREGCGSQSHLSLLLKSILELSDELEYIRILARAFASLLPFATMELLRNLRMSTRLLFLYEVTTSRHTRLRTIGERLGMTIQGTSEYAHGLEEDGLLSFVNSEYR